MNPEDIKHDMKYNYYINRKPPLGLTPRRIHTEKRIRDILDALMRYNDADLSIPQEWIDELSDLNYEKQNES